MSGDITLVHEGPERFIVGSCETCGSGRLVNLGDGWFCDDCGDRGAYDEVVVR